MTDLIYDYQGAYLEFMKAYKQGATSPEEVGEVIVNLANYFVGYNLEYAKADSAYRAKAAEIEVRVDPDTGKTLSSSRAKILSDATSESDKKTLYEAHIKNIDTMIQSLKALQKGLLHEYSYSGAV